MGMLEYKPDTTCCVVTSQVEFELIDGSGAESYRHCSPTF